MSFLGKIVKHKLFGVGKISEYTANILVVQFENKSSKFIYPDSFESFLVFEEAELQRTVEIDIAKKKEAFHLKQIEEEEMRKKQQEEHEKYNMLSTPEKKFLRMFQEDYHVEHLARQPILTYQEVEKQFGIKITGFGKGINPTPSAIVLISSIDKANGSFVYHDHWTSEGDYIYSGEGKNGDQHMLKGNFEVANSIKNLKPIHLFVKFSSKEYYYQGVFYLVNYTYEDDKDESGKMRKEYKFRLRKIINGSI